MGYVGKTNIKFSELNNIRVEKSNAGDWANDTQASFSALRSWFRLNTTNTDGSLPTTDTAISLGDFTGYGVQKIEFQALPETNTHYDNSGDAKMRLKFLGSPHTQFGSTIKISGGGAPSTVANISVAKGTTGWTVATGLGNATKWTPSSTHRVQVSTTDSTAKVLCGFDFYLNPGSAGASTSSGSEGSYISASSGGTPATASGTGANGIDYQVVSNIPNGGNGASVTGVDVIDTFEGTPLYKFVPGAFSGTRIDVVASFKASAVAQWGSSVQSTDSHGNAFTATNSRDIWSRFVTTNKGSIAKHVFRSNSISGSTWTGTINDPSLTLETHHGCTFIKYKLQSSISTGVFANGGAAIAMHGSQIGAWWKKSSSNPPADFKTSWGSQYQTGNNSAFVIHGTTRSKWWGNNSGGTTGTVTHATVTGMPALGNTNGIMTTGDDYLWIHADNNHGGGGNGYLSIVTSSAAAATFVVPADISKISVVLTGGGGGGTGGYHNSGAGGAGGGSGGVKNFHEFTVAEGDQLFIDVGKGGAGGVGTTGSRVPGTAGMSSRVTHSTTAAPRGDTIWVTGGLCSNLKTETTGGLGASIGGGANGGDGYFDNGTSQSGHGGDVSPFDQVKAAAAGTANFGITLKNANGGGTPCSGSGSYGGNGGYGSGGGSCNWSGTNHSGNQAGLYGGGGSGGTGAAGAGGDGVCWLVIDDTPTAGGLETIGNLVSDWNIANPTNTMTVSNGSEATIPAGTVVTLAGATTSNATKTRFNWTDRSTSTRSVYSKSIIANNDPDGPEATNLPQFTAF